MKREMIKLIQDVIKDNSKLYSLENIYELYDQLQYSENLKEMAETLCYWLKLKYNISNINFSLFDLDTEESTLLLKTGKDFHPDDQFAFYFIINTHTYMNAIVSFCSDDEETFKLLEKNQPIIDAAFFQISPLLQNGIIKKHHIEASSLDSVTNVYNRKHFINHLKKNYFTF